MIDDRSEVDDGNMTTNEWDTLESKISMMTPRQLEDMASRLRLDIEAGSSWRDYLAAFLNERWSYVTEAYEYATGRSYNN